MLTFFSLQQTETTKMKFTSGILRTVQDRPRKQKIPNQDGEEQKKL